MKTIELIHSNRWFLRICSPTEWVIRAAGFGIALRDHRERPPLFSERNQRGGALYVHRGPYCFRVFKRIPRGGQW